MKVLNYSWHDPLLGLLWTESEVCEVMHCARSHVRKVFGEPDALGINPRGGSYVRLYAQSRVRRARLAEVRRT